MFENVRLQVSVQFAARRSRTLTLDPLDLSFEPVHVVGRVLHHPGGTVRLDQAVRALDGAVLVAHLVLALHVTGERVVHRVPEMVRAGSAAVELMVALAVVVAVIVAVVAFGRRRGERESRGRHYRGTRHRDEHARVLQLL